MAVLSDGLSPVVVLTRQVGKTKLLYVGNANVEAREQIKIPLSTSRAVLEDLFSGKVLNVEANLLSVELAAGESALFEIS
jgi:hypothetical protein